ncbi:signal peptidase II [Oceanobacillus rekensis]|uniref:signal peptidase II n=1 Tax=Oceanobacillus rekensis TaxID=937927 RepID=UPI000B4407EF|nr:signal peptidase II [Oceanobacillus rekensis]
MRKKDYMLFYTIAIIVILIDQISKNLVRIFIDMNERFTWLGMEFTHIENSGMAGGLFPGNARLFGVIAVLFVIFVLYIRKTEDWKGLLIDSSFGFLVGGAIGNAIDRLLFGQVTDFIVRSGGVLNLADHAIEIGILLLILSVIVDWLKSKKWVLK